LLYSFAFILDPRAKMKGFLRVLRRLGNLTDSEYNTYQLSARARLTDVYNKYKAKYGDARLRRPVVPPNLSGKKRSAWDEIYDDDEGGGSPSGIGIHPLPATLNLSRAA
jgi:hypothetical protein